MRFQDTLYIIVSNGSEEEVQLRARGYGSTLFCQEKLDNIDFGTEYTHKNVPKQFFLENRGRKTMKIFWVRQDKKDRKKKTSDKASDTTKGAVKLASEKEPEDA